MSYSIIRVSKVKASGVTGIQIHDKREKNRSHTNEDIDWNKTKENIDLIDRKGPFKTIVNERIDELDLPRKVRKDATVMCQVLITSDSDFFDSLSEKETKTFFDKSFEFIKSRYGEENIVSATVHYDEKTPHLHVNFVPVTEDCRLSAKELFSPATLRVLQDEFNKKINDNGFVLERGKKDTKRKHMKVDEYKLKTEYAKQQYVEVTKDIESVEVEQKTVKNDLWRFKQEHKLLKSIFESENAKEIIEPKKILFSNKYTVDQRYIEQNLVNQHKNAEMLSKLLAKDKAIEEREKEFEKKSKNEKVKWENKERSYESAIEENKEYKQELKLLRKSKNFMQNEIDLFEKYLKATDQVEEYKKFGSKNRTISIDMDDLGDLLKGMPIKGRGNSMKL